MRYVLSNCGGENAVACPALKSGRFFRFGTCASKAPALQYVMPKTTVRYPKSVQVRMTAPMRAVLLRESKRSNLTVGELIRRAIDRYLDKP